MENKDSSKDTSFNDNDRGKTMKDGLKAEDKWVAPAGVLKLKDLMTKEEYKKALNKRMVTIENRLKTLKSRQYDMPGDILEFNEWIKELKGLEEKKRDIDTERGDV